MSKRHKRPRHTTEAQRPAARANGANSYGPISEGKAESNMNALNQDSPPPASSRAAKTHTKQKLPNEPGDIVEIQNRNSRPQRNSVRKTPTASTSKSISQNEPEQLLTQGHSKTCGIENRPLAA